VQVRVGLISFARTRFRRIARPSDSRCVLDCTTMPRNLRTSTLTEPARIAAKQLVAVAP
jgi:hypothetical protein